MSADIIKESIYDDRVVQSRPKFGVFKGALSLTNIPTSAISATVSQHTFQIYIPSENIYVDRALEWSSVFFLKTTASSAANFTVGQAIRMLGKDIALCAFPLNSLISTLQAVINDTTITINSEDVLNQVLRLTDYKDNRLQRTCPTMLDTYLLYKDGALAVNSPLSSYAEQTAHDMTPNGAYPYIQYTDANGVVLAGTGTYTDENGQVVNYINGVPTGGAYNTCVLYFKVYSTEKLVMSPFVFADKHEWDTGLFGVNAISIVANLRQPARLLRNNSNSASGTAVVIANTAFNTNAPGGGFMTSQINTQCLTPPLSIELPPKNVVQYMEFPRYISNPGPAVNPGATSQIVSNTLTLPMIPDYIIVYVRPVVGSAVYAPQYGDGYFAVANRFDGVPNPIQIQFDNFSGLLSSQTTEQLYAMAVHNGLEMDWATWSGRAYSNGANVSGGNALGGVVPTVGSLLVLRFGQDITLQEGQAGSLVGNYTLSIQLQVKNNFDVAVQPQMVIITANSGFVETIRGSSRVIKGVLSEQDIISAPMSSTFTRSSYERLVGSGFMSNLSSALSKAKEIYSRTKPVVSAIRGALPEEGMAGKVKGALGAVGYGTGAGTGAGKRKSLAERLM